MDQYKKDSAHNRGISWLKNVSHRFCSSSDVKFLLNYVSFDNTYYTPRNTQQIKLEFRNVAWNRAFFSFKKKGRRAAWSQVIRNDVFFEMGKLQVPEKNHSGQGREPTTTHIRHRLRDTNPGQFDGWRRALTIKLYRGAFLCLKTVDLRQSNSDTTDASGSTAVWGRNVFLTLTLLQQILSRTVYSLYGVTWIFTSCIASHQMRNGACLLVQRWPEVVWEDYKVFAYTFGFLSSNLLT